jgi:hypothetical protein
MRATAKQRSLATRKIVAITGRGESAVGERYARLYCYQ